MTGGMGFWACGAQRESDAGDVRFGSKAELDRRPLMSALCQKRTWVGLFNDVVGVGEQLLRHGQTKGLRCPKIDC